MNILPTLFLPARRRFRLLVGLAAVAWSATLLFGVGTATTSQRVSDFGLIVAAFAAAYACFRAARIDRRNSRVWWLLGISAFSWGCGQSVWTWYESILGRDVPFPSTADIGYLCAVPFAVAALACLPSAPQTLAGRVRTILDGMMIAGSLLVVSWVLVLNAVFQAGGDTFLKQAISLAYPIGDVVVVTIVVYVMLRIRQAGMRPTFPLGLIGAALFALAFADSGFAYLTATNAYVSGSFIDIGWFLGYTLILVAAAHPTAVTAVDHVEHEAPSDRSASFLLPYAAISMALAVSTLDMIRTGKWHSLVPWVRTFIIVALVVRQILTLRENTSLTENLEARLTDLGASERRFQGLVRHSSDVVTVLAADGTVQYQSESMQRVFGHDADRLVGKTLADVLDYESAARLRCTVDDVLAEPHAVRELEVHVRHSSGHVCSAEMTVTNLLDDPAVRGIVLNTRDISEQKTLEQKLVHQAFHDSLTALANRALFRDRVEEILQRSGPRGVAILFLDLDGFKQVNDLLGHASGDELLVEVAERLHESVRPADTVARLGGDEFAVLLEDADGPDAERIARRITSSLQRPFSIDGQEVHIRGSVGIASAGRGLVEADKLLRNADLAMYRAKAAGEGGFRWYDPDLHVDLVERLQLVSDLRNAIDVGELVLHYQPTVQLSTGRIMGVEALVRWTHPARGLVPPEQFVPLAEESGLIGPLGRWVLAEACREGARWHTERPRRKVTIGVNISGRQLEESDFVDQVAAALEESGLPPDLLLLEMTESVLLDDTGSALERVKRLKELGVRLAIDDFGTGYSSLSYLHRFPIDVLKIDRAFVEQLRTEASDGSLASAIVRIARSLEMATVAEGVENAQQVATLRRIGCDLAQGYHFSRPAVPELIDQLLAAEPVRRARSRAAA